MKLGQWRYKRFHVSYLLSWLAVGLLLGIALSKVLSVMIWPFVAISLFMMVTSFRSRRWYACVIVAIAGMVFGMMRGASFYQDISLADGYIGQKVMLRGTITQDPMLVNGSDSWSVQLSSITINDKPIVGEVYATAQSDDALKRGDTISLEGKAKEGFGSFRISFYRVDIVSIERHDNLFLSARDSFAESVRRVMIEPEASLGLGFLVGQKSELPGDLSEQLKVVGLTHIVVASGYNLTILIRFARRLLARRSRYLAFIGSITLVVGFVLVSGFSPSMNRAAAVTILSLLAWYFGRKFHPVQLILYVASVSALIYPSYLWSDIGWMLSFTAFIGVLVVAPMVSQMLMKNKNEEQGVLSRLVIETLSAEIMTLPILIFTFGYIPVLALLANVLVAPVIPFAMLATFVAGCIGLVAPWLSLFAMPADIVIAYIVSIVQSLSGAEWAKVSFSLPSWSLFLWYGGLLVGGLLIWRRFKVDLMRGSVVE